MQIFQSPEFCCSPQRAGFGDWVSSMTYQICFQLWLRSVIESAWQSTITLAIYHRMTEFILSTVDVVGWIILCCGSCPICYRMFRSTSAVPPPDASRTSFPSHHNQCRQKLPYLPWASSCVRTTEVKQSEWHEINQSHCELNYKDTI